MLSLYDWAVELAQTLREYFSPEWRKKWAIVIQKATSENPWFIPEHINYALNAWYEALSDQEVERWLSPYRDIMQGVRFDDTNQKVLGIVLPANVPLAGLEDIIYGLVAGYRLQVKLSERARALFQFLIQELKGRIPVLEDRIQVVDRLANIDVVIASGSNHTLRVLKEYLGRYPSILRGSRTSVAILTGEETEDELYGLAQDIFIHFGLGCRNVSMLFVPEESILERLISQFPRFGYVKDHPLYMANLDYQYAVCLINKLPHIYTPELLLRRESGSPFSPVATVYYQVYRGLEEVLSWLDAHRDDIQIVVSKMERPDMVKPGYAQKMKLYEYPDGVDVLNFLFKQAGLSL